MKKQYIRPLTEVVVVRTHRLLEGDGTGEIKPDTNPSEWSWNPRAHGRETEFLDDEQEGGFGYRRYNLWE